MTHRYVEIASEIAAWAPVEAAELATADETGLITSVRAGSVSGRCPGKYALGRAVAAYEADRYKAFGGEFSTSLLCKEARERAENAEIEVVEYHQNARFMDADDGWQSGEQVEKRRYRSTAKRNPERMAQIRAEVERRCALAAADPDVRHWRETRGPKPPADADLSDRHCVAASEWDRVKARWERLDALLVMLAAPIA